MDDSFHEQIVKARRSPAIRLKAAGLSILGLVLLILIVYFSRVLGLLMPVLLFGVGYGLFYTLQGFSREFEYTVTNGELDIDLIIAQRKRIRIFSGPARLFDAMTLVRPGSGTAQMNGQSGRQAQIKDCRAAQVSGDYYQIRTHYEGHSVQIWFNPDEQMQNLLKRHNPSRITLG